MKRASYTPFRNQIPYETGDPSQDIFDTNSATYVSQGDAELSLNGSSLSSEGFSTCSALLLRHRNTTSALFHLDKVVGIGERSTEKLIAFMSSYLNGLDIDNDYMDYLRGHLPSACNCWNPPNPWDSILPPKERSKVAKAYNELNKDDCLRATHINGDRSLDRSYRINRDLLLSLGITSSKTIRVPTGQDHWGIIYSPDGTLLVDSKDKESIFEYTI